MSSSVLIPIQNQIVFYGYPTFISLGYIGNILIIIVFARQQQNTCSIFLISSAVASLFYLSFNYLIQFAPTNYQDGTVRAFAVCKTRYYFGNILGQIARILFVAAAFDRFMYTSNRASIRAFITPKRAKYCVFIVVIFWPLFACHIPILVTINNGQCGSSGVYFTIYTIYLILFVGLVPSTLVAILGYLAYRHVVKSRGTVQPTPSTTIPVNANVRRRNRNLLTIVMSESVVYFITTIPYPLIYLELLITRYMLTSKSVEHVQIENFLINMTLLLLYVNNAIPFYVYMMAAKSFRKDVKQLFVDIYRKLKR